MTLGCEFFLPVNQQLTFKGQVQQQEQKGQGQTKSV